MIFENDPKLQEEDIFTRLHDHVKIQCVRKSRCYALLVYLEIKYAIQNFLRATMYWSEKIHESECMCEMRMMYTVLF